MADLDTARRCAEAMMATDRASKALGISFDIPEPGRAVASMAVREDMVNGFNTIHGGLTFALADTAFAFACNAYNERSVAAGAQIEFLRPGRLGDRLTATAREDYRGRRTGHYTIEVRNQQDELIALFRGRSKANGDPIVSNK